MSFRIDADAPQAADDEIPTMGGMRRIDIIAKRWSGLRRGDDAEAAPAQIPRQENKSRDLRTVLSSEGTSATQESKTSAPRIPPSTARESALLGSRVEGDTTQACVCCL